MAITVRRGISFVPGNLSGGLSSVPGRFRLILRCLLGGLSLLLSGLPSRFDSLFSSFRLLLSGLFGGLGSFLRRISGSLFGVLLRLFDRFCSLSGGLSLLLSGLPVSFRLLFSRLCLLFSRFRLLLSSLFVSFRLLFSCLCLLLSGLPVGFGGVPVGCATVVVVGIYDDILPGAAVGADLLICAFSSSFRRICIPVARFFKANIADADMNAQRNAAAVQIAGDRIADRRAIPSGARDKCRADG